MRKNIVIAAIGMILLAFGLAATAGAQQRRGARMGFGKGECAMLELRQFARGLNLTDQQREEIRKVLQERQPEILEAREAIIQARLALVNEQPNAAEAFGAAHARAASLRLDIVRQLKAQLTPEQLEAVNKKMQRQDERLEQMLKRLNTTNPK